MKQARGGFSWQQRWRSSRARRSRRRSQASGTGLPPARRRRHGWCWRSNDRPRRPARHAAAAAARSNAAAAANWGNRRRHLRDRSVGVSEAERTSERPRRRINAEIYAVQQIYALRYRRFELMPYWGFTLNDQFVSHPRPGLALNYYITNVLAVGVERQLLPGLNGDSDFNFQNRRATRLAVPLNEYQWSAALNFTYVPMYGKFAGFGSFIFHYDALRRRRRRRDLHAPDRGHRPGQPQVRLRAEGRLQRRHRPPHLLQPLVRRHGRGPRLHLHREAREPDDRQRADRATD